MNTSSRSIRNIVAIALLLVLLIQSPTSLACGPFTLSAIFTFTVHPPYPLEKFAAGELGVLQPGYARSYLVVAYRQLAGIELSQEEREALVSLWHERLNFSWPTQGEDWIESWTKARAKVAEVGPAPTIDVYRRREKPNEYESYLNCPQDAFANATNTLNARVAKLGATNPQLRDWIQAQDQVFANCSEGTHIPQAAAADSDSLIRYDRGYQIAAANFYAGNFEEARKLFSEIERDKSSPWQSSAAYLRARALLREGSVGAPEKKTEALTAAENALNAILANADLRDYHEASRRLLSIVAFRLHPEQRVSQLARSLVTRNQGKALKQQLWDYTLLLDQFLGEDESGQQKIVPPALRNDELTDWLITFQSSSAESLEHSLAEWRNKQTVPWLIAAATKMTPGHPQSEQVLKAAAALAPDTPGFASASFHIVRMAIANGRAAQARAKLDELLASHRGAFPRSTVNEFESQRLLLATSLEDFLQHAQKVPAAFSWDDDGREIPAEESEQSEETKALSGKPLFDLDVTKLFNRQFPLSTWKRAAESTSLAPHLQRDVAQAAWLRAVLLDDSRTADALVPTLKSLIPELSGPLNDYAKTTTPDAKKFAALFLWLKTPGLEPIVDSGIGRGGAVSEQDSYRDNWWCNAAFPETSVSGAQPKVAAPPFLNQNEQAAGKTEAARLASFGATPNYLAREVIQWASKHPRDPRVPEALHLVVKTTRFGCTDKETARWSKAAYDLLHRRYPRSIWTKRTPYWFKD